MTATLHRDGLLEIEGRGDVQTYSYAEDLPWEDYRENIKEVTFDANVLPTNLAHWFEVATHYNPWIFQETVWKIWRTWQ